MHEVERRPPIGSHLQPMQPRAEGWFDGATLLSSLIVGNLTYGRSSNSAGGHLWQADPCGAPVEYRAISDSMFNCKLTFQCPGKG